MKDSSAVARPNPWLNWNTTVFKIKFESQGVATYDLVIDDAQVAERYAFLPGQFNMIYVPGIGEAAISISGSFVEPLVLQHTIREAGNVTQALAGMKEGDGVGVRGPFGSAWPMETLIRKDVVLVAGGIGMAPLRPVVNEFIANRELYRDVTLLLGARSPEGLLYGDELQLWQESIDVQRTVDRSNADWNGNVGVVTALLERLPLPRPERTVLLTCGPDVMMWYTIRTALDRGLNESNVWVSLERNMNCAVGFCGHCQLGPQFVCKDGPIFRYDRVASLLQVEGL